MHGMLSLSLCCLLEIRKGTSRYRSFRL